MSNLTDSDLRDPTPPIPGERERNLVATRAHQLGRRRRMLQGLGALAVVAAVSVSVAALAAGGDPGGSGRTNRVDAANSAADTTDAPVTTAAPTTVAPTLPPAPAPSPDPAPTNTGETPAPTAPAVVEAPVAPSTFTGSGTVGNIPAGATVTLTFDGPGGPFTASVDAAGNYSISGLTAGTYDVIGQHVDPSDSASGAERFGSITISGNFFVNFSFT